MSAQGWVGRQLRIAIDGEVVAAVRGKSVSFARSPIDISDGEMDGFRRLAAEADVSTVDVSVEGVCTEANWPALHALWAGDALAPVSVLHPNGAITSGDAFLSGLSRTAESGGYVAFSATLQLTGGAVDGLYLTSEIYPTPAQDVVLLPVPFEVNFEAGSDGIDTVGWGGVTGWGTLIETDLEYAEWIGVNTYVGSFSLGIDNFSDKRLDLSGLVGAVVTITGPFGERVLPLSTSQEGAPAPGAILEINDSALWYWPTVDFVFEDGQEYTVVFVPGN
jgi:predicted secreted protein